MSVSAYVCVRASVSMRVCVFGRACVRAWMRVCVTKLMILQSSARCTCNQ